MSMTKYGTLVVFQNTETDEVKEIPLADEEELQKYAGSKDWKRVGEEENSSEPSTENSSEEE